MSEWQEDPTVKCKNPLCERRVTTALYCCGMCANAHEGRWEIDDQAGGQLGHSDACTARYAEYREKASEHGWRRQ